MELVLGTSLINKINQETGELLDALLVILERYYNSKEKSKHFEKQVTRIVFQIFFNLKKKILKKEDFNKLKYSFHYVCSSTLNGFKYNSLDDRRIIRIVGFMDRFKNDLIQVLSGTYSLEDDQIPLPSSDAIHDNQVETTVPITVTTSATTTTTTTQIPPPLNSPSTPNLATPNNNNQTPLGASTSVTSSNSTPSSSSSSPSSSPLSSSFSSASFGLPFMYSKSPARTSSFKEKPTHLMNSSPSSSSSSSSPSSSSSGSPKRQNSQKSLSDLSVSEPSSGNLNKTPKLDSSQSKLNDRICDIVGMIANVEFITFATKQPEFKSIVYALHYYLKNKQK